MDCRVVYVCLQLQSSTYHFCKSKSERAKGYPLRKKKSYLRSFVCFSNPQSQLLGKLLPQLRDAFILGTKPSAGHFQFCLCGTHNEIDRDAVILTGLHQEASLVDSSQWTIARAALGESMQT